MRTYTVKGIPEDQYKELRDKAADETKAETEVNSINKQILEAIRIYLEK